MAAAGIVARHGISGRGSVRSILQRAKSLVRKGMATFGFDVIHSVTGANMRKYLAPEMTVAEADMIRSVEPYTMAGAERLWALTSSVRYLNAAKISGAIVECGVWRGGNVLLSKRLCRQAGVTRDYYLFDTFSGMSEPTEADNTAFSAEQTRERYESSQAGDHNKWCYASLEDVRESFARFSLLDDDVKFVEGKVEETLSLPENLPEEIALLRLDTDWYESTKVELEVLYPRLKTGGVLIIDDYGYWEGARKAVDEYFASSPVLLSRIDATGRLLVKP